VRSKNVVALAVVAVVLLVTLIWLLSGGMMGWGTGSGMMGWGGYGSSGSGIVMLIVGALVVGGAVWLGASLLSPGRVAATVPIAGSDEPLAILKQRYAHGELTREEYGQMRKELER
jgi:uncharacterized membrane protein